MYIIVWKYTIKPEFRDRFELEYGSEGKWSKLFRESKSYRGSHLHRDVMNPNVYLLIDTWTDKNAYDNFKRVNSLGYEEQSKNFEYLYENEELIGSYTST